MNSFLLIVIGVPIFEIILMIKIGAKIGLINTILLIIFTATVGVYYARIEGLSTIQSGLKNLYQNKAPVYEMMSGASIALAAVLLILPGFITDTLGFILLFPFSRRFIITRFLKNKKMAKNDHNKDIIDGEIIENKNKTKKDDEL
jgi:UPF0716 protein FxsA